MLCARKFTDRITNKMAKNRVNIIFLLDVKNSFLNKSVINRRPSTTEAHKGPDIFFLHQNRGEATSVDYMVARGNSILSLLKICFNGFMSDKR